MLGVRHRHMVKEGVIKGFIYVKKIVGSSLSLQEQVWTYSVWGHYIHVLSEDEEKPITAITTLLLSCTRLVLNTCCPKEMA